MVMLMSTTEAWTEVDIDLCIEVNSGVAPRWRGIVGLICKIEIGQGAST